MHKVEFAAPKELACPPMIRTIVVVLAFAVPSILLAAAWLQPVYDPSFFTRDPLAIVSGLASRGNECCSRFTGAISMIGIMLWSATAAITCLAALLLLSLKAERTEIALFAIVSALTVWMVLDDAFMLHEGYSPKAFGFSISHFLPMLAMLPIMALLLRMRGRSHLALLGLALGAFAASLAIDDLIAGGNQAIFAEDAFKLFGISFWSAFFLLTAIDRVLRAASARLEICLPPGQP